MNKLNSLIQSVTLQSFGDEQGNKPTYIIGQGLKGGTSLHQSSEGPHLISSIVGPVHFYHDSKSTVMNRDTREAMTDFEQRWKEEYKKKLDSEPYRTLYSNQSECLQLGTKLATEAAEEAYRASNARGRISVKIVDLKRFKDEGGEEFIVGNHEVDRWQKR
ncbi:uncharacterized protein L203_104737 [Cryptococcus depauperatus CBS 7841]|uniref:Uncharacterized protein n=1 Tax=Cryptococcus depauperatus CBS 7841 TaxID=1295531 RepID=A0AAJ8JW11_9TREE